MRAATLALSHEAKAGRSLYEGSDGIAADQSAQDSAANAEAVRGDELDLVDERSSAKSLRFYNALPFLAERGADQSARKCSR
jgi:hypothetical protein